jgi:Domain of unknown function (DUF4167)
VAGYDDRREPMRQGQQNRRGRGRSNSSSNNNNNNNTHNNSHNNNGRKPQNPLARNYESSGPDVKIRGTAAQVAEKYMTLARDAHSAGDPVLAENYLQHAEHYNRIIMAAQQAQVAPFAQPQNVHGVEPMHGFNGGPHRPQSDQPFMRDQPQPVIDQPQAAPLPGMEPQPEISQEALDDAAAAAIDETQAQARDDNSRRRRRRYPAGGGPNRAASAPTAAEPAGGNGHNGAANGLDGPAGETRPPDEVLAN